MGHGTNTSHCSQSAVANRLLTRWLKLKHVILTVLETGKCKIKVPADLLSGESPLPGLQTGFLISSQGRVQSEHKGTNRIQEAPPA